MVPFLVPPHVMFEVQNTNLKIQIQNTCIAYGSGDPKRRIAEATNLKC